MALLPTKYQLKKCITRKTSPWTNENNSGMQQTSPITKCPAVRNICHWWPATVCPAPHHLPLPPSLTCLSPKCNTTLLHLSCSTRFPHTSRNTFFPPHIPIAPPIIGLLHHIPHRIRFATSFIHHMLPHPWLDLLHHSYTPEHAYYTTHTLHIPPNNRLVTHHYTSPPPPTSCNTFPNIASFRFITPFMLSIP